MNTLMHKIKTTTSLHRIVAVVLSSFLAASLSAASKEPKLGPDGYPLVTSKPSEAADEYLNLHYLPEWRYTGDKSVRRDYEMVLDLWVPKGKKNCPLIMYVHGGSYTGGTKHLGKGLEAWQTER